MQNNWVVSEVLGFEFCLENLLCLQKNTAKNKTYSQSGFSGGCHKAPLWVNELSICINIKTI